jgi:hypothetical protein
MEGIQEGKRRNDSLIFHFLFAQFSLIIYSTALHAWKPLFIQNPQPTKRECYI